MKNFYLTQKLSQRDKGLGQGKTNDMRVLENIYLSLMCLDNDRNWKHEDISFGFLRFVTKISLLLFLMFWDTCRNAKRNIKKKSNTIFS